MYLVARYLIFPGGAHTPSLGEKCNLQIVLSVLSVCLSFSLAMAGTILQATQACWPKSLYSEHSIWQSIVYTACYAFSCLPKALSHAGSFPRGFPSPLVLSPASVFDTTLFTYAPIYCTFITIIFLKAWCGSYLLLWIWTSTFCGHIYVACCCYNYGI